MVPKFLHFASRKARHLFHVISNVRPLVWIGIYLIAIPIFAVLYSLLPQGSFRVPDGGSFDFGACIYYSIVTISTLGFGDYTPCVASSECLTALEVMCGITVLGFFLNAVGAMKSEIDVESEAEKQRRVNISIQKQRLEQMTPATLRVLHAFVNHCNKLASAKSTETTRAAINDLMKSAARCSLTLDTLQNHVDLTIWPELLEDCFAFVANYQILSIETGPKALSLETDGTLSSDLQTYLADNTALAAKIEASLTRVALPEE